MLVRGCFSRPKQILQLGSFGLRGLWFVPGLNSKITASCIQTKCKSFTAGSVFRT